MRFSFVQESKTLPVLMPTKASACDAHAAKQKCCCSLHKNYLCRQHGKELY